MESQAGHDHSGCPDCRFCGWSGGFIFLRPYSDLAQQTLKDPYVFDLISKHSLIIEGSKIFNRWDAY
ncbi:MAG: hypothetical protein MUD05_09665, partial [Candidatus Nanopelagicales bacterium]|nr:hypothetical protein [Candidatus Nanopelagicales bacterium]